MTQSVVSGWCEPRFAAVREQFELNFAERGEMGAAVCLIQDGTIVADLRGGWTDAAHQLPWAPDTLVNVFSVGKGVLAACLARLMGQGLLTADAPVASYWPQFGAAAKDEITVRQLLSHQAGLPAIRAVLPPGSGLDWQLMTSMLAAEEPWWPPGSGHGYHVNTFGYLGGELIRRITGRTPGEYLERELAGPLGADVHIGLPPAEHYRVAEFFWPLARPEGAEQAGGKRVADEPVPHYQMALNAYFNPPDFSGAGVVNTPAWRSAQMPSANMHATGTGVARIYAALAAAPWTASRSSTAAHSVRRLKNRCMDTTWCWSGHHGSASASSSPTRSASSEAARDASAISVPADRWGSATRTPAWPSVT